jgi:hypothetical protein
MSAQPLEISTANSISSLSYEEIKEKAVVVENLYRDHGIELPRSCDLAIHCEQAPGVDHFFGQTGVVS